MSPMILDSVLLFALSIPVVMHYRILPVEGTPYWLFGILFLVLAANVCISVYPKILGRWGRYIDGIKLALLIITIGISLGGATVTAISDRSKTAPVDGVHDIILQQEAAMRYLIVGKNPYRETYFGTPVESFHYAEIDNDKAVNPALYHFVMPPWYLLFPFPFYFVSNRVFGFFDGREVLLFTMGMLLTFLWFWYKDKGVARIAMTLTALSPSVVTYFVEGRSDVFALGFLMGALVLLERRRYVFSGFFLALAMLSKQTVWFILPFYLVCLWRIAGAQGKNVLLRTISVMMVTAGLLTVPFLVWDARAFIDSVILYLTGSAAHSYPVSGYGLGMVLYEFGVIRDIHAYYPFAIWQLIIAGPVLLLLLRAVWKTHGSSGLMLSYAVMLFVYWYMSRYFNNSHLGYLSMLFVIGGLKAADEGKL